MTPEEAKANLGRAVEYVPAHKRKPGAVLERGVITSVGTAYACVRFEGDVASKARRPSDLRFVEGLPPTVQQRDPASFRFEHNAVRGSFSAWDLRAGPVDVWELRDGDRPVPGRWTRLPDGGLSWVPTSTVTVMTTNEPQPETTEVAVEQPAKITTTTEVDATADTVNVDPTSDAGPAEAQPAAVEVHTKD